MGAGWRPFEGLSLVVWGRIYNEQRDGIENPGIGAVMGRDSTVTTWRMAGCRRLKSRTGILYETF